MSQQNFLPVPVKSRADGWTPEKQWRFVELLAQTASIGQAVRAVGMTARSAHRLRLHPQAAAFRAAWDAALGQAWGLLDQAALDRAINGERETIERNGFLVAERHKPCSDRLLIHMLAMRERAQVAERAERMAQYRAALAAAEFAALQARSDHGRRLARKNPPPPIPERPDDAAAATAALQAFHALGAAFEPWPTLDDTMDEALDEAMDAPDSPPPRPAPPPAWPEAEDDVIEVAVPGFDFATRPRWEDYAAAEAAEAAAAKAAEAAAAKVPHPGSV